MHPAVAEQTIAENLANLNAGIAEAAAAAGRVPDEVTLIAVSKTKPAAAVAEALAAGQRIFGENRVQEALSKMDDVPPEAEWHLVGHLQTNKARRIPGRFALVHSLDSGRLALALANAMENRVMENRAQDDAKLGVLIQLNLDREATKSGVAEDAELRGLVETVLGCGALELRGLMTMPDPALGESGTRRHFSEVRGLRDKLRAEFGLGPSFRELSMGMSHDYRWAIAEGATMVRIGAAIFGARP